VTPDAAGPDARADATDSRETPPSGLCARPAPPLTLSAPPLVGALMGPSDNAFVSCGGLSSTPGPEAVFTLQLAQVTTLELRVDSTIDTVIAIRPGCGADISEIACGDRPPVENSPPDGGAAKSTALRVSLAPGTYVVLVETRAANVAGPVAFTLTASPGLPAQNGDCAHAPSLSLPAHVASEPLDLAGTLAAPCTTDSGRAHYHAVTVPAGQQLSATVTAQAGDRVWTPRLAALGGCGAGTCLAQGHAVAIGTTQQLDWTNHTVDPQTVILSVSADVSVMGAAFELSVSATDVPATCAHPTPVVDGTVLSGQDLRRAPPPPSPSCVGTQDHALYYTATLLPQQRLSVDMIANATPSVPFSSQDYWSLRPSCGVDADPCFLGAAGSQTFTNLTSAPLTVFIEASPADPNAGTFDLHVSMPAPPAGITLTGAGGLVTTEAGGTATFQVALATPPKAAVVLGVASDTPGEGIASPASLQFDATNWNVPQTVTVTGVDDQAADGPRVYAIVTGAAVSTDARYAGLNADDVLVTNLDDEPGLLIEGARALATSESGARATFTARLTRPPTGTVRTTLTSSDISEGTVFPAELVFSPSNWNVPQTVTVTGVDDALADGAQSYAIVTGAWTGADPSYVGKDPSDVTVHNRDDDLRAVGKKLLNPDVDCDQLDPMAVDGFGTLYLLLRCGGTVSVTTSADGGATFSERVALPSGAQTATWGQISAGEGGVAYVLAATSEGAAFTRTTDGGATWSALQLVAPPDLGYFQLASAGSVLDLVVYVGPHDSILWRSLDAGRTFFPRTRIDDGAWSATAMPDGTSAVWLTTGSDNAEFLESPDGGGTFASVGVSAAPASSNVIGVRTAYIFDSNGLDVIDLRDASVTRRLAAAPAGIVVVDEADNLTIVYADPTSGQLNAWRLAAGASAPLPAKSLGSGGQLGPSIGAVALSRNAVATAFASGGLVLFGVTTWP
ncbi:MAG: hypothetical protein JWM82_3512, partial [Myxococcales bacterium]|nr:hypothetical protein [Myxococcales bacterium]